MKIFKDGHTYVLGIKQDLFRTDTGCNIIVGKEQGLWHLSISHDNRNPTWEEIRDARYDLLSRTKKFAMILPPPEEYVNVHNFCFHLHELTEKEQKNINDVNGKIMQINSLIEDLNKNGERLQAIGRYLILEDIQRIEVVK